MNIPHDFDHHLNEVGLMPTTAIGKTVCYAFVDGSGQRCVFITTIMSIGFMPRPNCHVVLITLHDGTILQHKLCDDKDQCGWTCVHSRFTSMAQIDFEVLALR